MHINLSYGNTSNLLASQSVPVASAGTTREAEAGAIQRSHGVSFSQVVDDHTPSAPPPGADYEAERNAWGKGRSMQSVLQGIFLDELSAFIYKNMMPTAADNLAVF